MASSQHQFPSSFTSTISSAFLISFYYPTVTDVRIEGRRHCASNVSAYVCFWWFKVGIFPRLMASLRIHLIVDDISTIFIATYHISFEKFLSVTFCHYWIYPTILLTTVNIYRQFYRSANFDIRMGNIGYGKSSGNHFYGPFLCSTSHHLHISYHQKSIKYSNPSNLYLYVIHLSLLTLQSWVKFASWSVSHLGLEFSNNQQAISCVRRTSYPSTRELIFTHASDIRDAAHRSLA